MKCIVAGSRWFTNYEFVESKLESLFSNIDWHTNPIEIVSGTCRGVDRLGERFAEERGWHYVRFPADWDKHGKAAGPIRNEEMAKYADTCVVFTGDGDRGSASMIDMAKKHNLSLRIIKFTNLDETVYV